MSLIPGAGKIGAALLKNGYAVCDLPLSAVTLKCMQAEVEQLHRSESFFQKSGQPNHRSDTIGWLSDSDAHARGFEKIPLALDILLRQVPEVLHQELPAAEYPLLAPASAMLSTYADGAAYAPHRDGVHRNDLGVVGAARGICRAYLKGGNRAAMVSGEWVPN
jgi:hypothetical protein